MEERIFLYEKSAYKSSLHNGTITFMALLCVDLRIPMLLKKERIIEIVIKQLKEQERVEFPDIAMACEKEVQKLLPNCDLTELRKLIVKYYIVQKATLIPNIDIINLVTVSNKKVLKYLDEQLYINVLNCVYDLMIKASKILSLDTFSKNIVIGEKTCNALYPGIEFYDAIEMLAEDIQSWINYNLLNGFCSIEDIENGIYLKVTI